MESDMRVVLIGKTGTGKSSVGNSLLKTKVFRSSAFGATDSTCQSGNRPLPNGTKLTVVDTPGLLAAESFTEIARCFDLCTPGPHMFLLVLKIGRFTPEDQTMAKHLVELFGDDVVKYVIIVFTGKDSLDSDEIQLKEYLQDVPKELEDLISKCGRRVAAINNRAAESDGEADVNAILNLVETEIKNNGNDCCYSQEMYDKAQEVAAARRRVELESKAREIADARRREELESKARGVTDVRGREELESNAGRQGNIEGSPSSIDNRRDDSIWSYPMNFFNYIMVLVRMAFRSIFG